jgi:hypothetical protein
MKTPKLPASTTLLEGAFLSLSPRARAQAAASTIARKIVNFLTAAPHEKQYLVKAKNCKWQFF